MNASLPGGGNPYEELKRVSRILQLIQMVTMAPKRFKRRDLAERFEIGERMIQKDLAVIRHGLKLSLRLSSKGYYFEELPHLPAVQYTLTEAIALLTAVQAASNISWVGSPELAAAVARLEALFPVEFAPVFHQLRIKPVMTVRGKHRQQMLLLLNRAFVEQRKVRITYETRSRAGAVTERVVRPYHLMPYVRSWQLIAYCELRQDVLMFKLDRIQEATLLDESYRIQADFNLDSYLGWAWGIIRGDSQPPEEIELLFETDTGHRVMEEEWHPSQAAEVLADGQVRFTLRSTVTPELISWLLYYGSRVEVKQPFWLRERVREELRRAVAIYAGSEKSTLIIDMEP